MERQDPLRTGAIFKVLPQSMKAPPKIVKFDTPKTSTPSSTTKTVQDPLREAFNQIYRATPTPKMFIGRAIGGFNSSNNSPYWPSNPVQQPTVDSPLATSHTNSENHSSHQPTSATVTDEPNSHTSSISSNSKSVPATTTISESTPRNVLTKISPNASKVARIQSSATESTAAAQSKPSRSTSASSSSSRGGSRSRAGGSDSLLLLVGGITRPISSTASNSSSSKGSNARETSQRSSSTERNTSSSGGSRGKRAEEAQRVSLVQSAPIKQNVEIAHSSAKQADNSKTPAKKQASVEPVTAIVASTTRNSPDVSVPSSSTSKSNALSSIPKTKPAAGGKRKRTVVDESEASETDNSPPEKTRAVPAKNSKRVSLGTGKNKRQNGSTQGSETGSKSGKSSMDTGETEQDEEEGEEVLTVTRSGRKSLPKKVIPLAEDVIQGEKQQQKANRGKRAASVPASSSSRRRGTSATTAATTAAAGRKSLGTSSAATPTAPTRKATSTRNTAWSTSEVMALYQAQGSTDISAPDFWEQVAEGVAAVGFHRTAEECQQQWFVAVEEAAARKRNKEEKMKNKPKETETRAAAEAKEDNGEPPVPVKAKRTSKNALKKMAQESSKATRDDDIFDSDAMRSYWAEDSAMDVADFLPTGDDLFEDLQLFESTTTDPIGSMAGGSVGRGMKNGTSDRAGKLVGQKRTNEEEEDPLDTEIEFGTSHVHKLHYRPPSKLFSAKSTIMSGETRHTSGKQGKLSATQIHKQVNAAVQGARKTTGADDSSESGSDELESGEEDDE